MKPERQTRQEKIDLQLGRAGWAVGSRRLLEELLIETTTTLNEPAGDYRTANEFADYALLDRLGRVLAIVDALKQPPFSAIGDPEILFPPEVLRDMLDLTRQLAAA